MNSNMEELGHLATTEIEKSKYGSDVVVITRSARGYKIVNPDDVRLLRVSLARYIVFGVIDFTKDALHEVMRAICSHGLRMVIA